nr:zinc finger, CCHC-type [Tanacetum cinerariifolium]
MRALLIQHGCEAALEVLPKDMEAQTKADLNKKAHSAVILYLGNKVLREVTEKTTAAGVWSKLKTLYMTKLFANKLYLKKKLYTFYMPAGRKISKHIDEFNKIVLDLANIEDVMATLNSKKIKERSKAKGDDGEGLYVRGRTNGRDSRQSRGKSRSKSRGGRLKCYICQSEDHLKRNCPKNNRKKSSSYVNKDDQPSSSGSIYDGSEVLLGDNRECKTRGIGKVRLQLKDGLSFVLYNVRYIPELKRNLISLGTLEKEGYTVKLQSGKIKVINGSMVVLSGTRRDNCVYSLDGHAVAGELNASVEEKDSLAQVWHKRLGHISEAGLQVLEKQGLFGKKSLVNQTGRTVKKLRTNNGLEFCNREFKQLCIDSGIARHLTVVGTPQQNGLAKRMNRTLMDKVRCLLIQSGLPKTFWAEVTCTAAYLINRSPSTAIEKKTPMEMWSRHPSDYGMLKTFGCIACSTRLRWNCKDYQLVQDRKPRTRTKPLKFRDKSNMAAYAFAAAEEEDTHKPLTYQEAVACEDSSKWKAAMKEEMYSLRKNKTWELVDHQAGQKLVTCKWLFKIKEGIEGVQKPRYKARLVARGFTQRAGIDYNELFSPVVRHTSIGVILALTACKDFELEQLDVKTTFLHGNLEEVIYMRQPPGYEQDDMLIACKSKAEIGSTKSLLKREFDMKDLGEAKKILGTEIVKDRSRKILRVSQSGYISKVLNNFRIENGKSVQMPLGGHFKLSLKDCPIKDCDVERMSKVPYANAVGSLMYLMVCTRPDIAYAVSIVSRYLVNSGKNHWEAVKWILKYLRGTANVGLIYGTNRG